MKTNLNNELRGYTPHYHLEVSLNHKLLSFGWEVYNEVWVRKDRKQFRVDILGFHKKFRPLGWFIFELKTDDDSYKNITEAHKQIVQKYIGSKVYDFKRPNLEGIKPSCFVYCPPQEEEENYYYKNNFSTIRFFNRYGIGLLNHDDTIIFHPNHSSKYKINLDPSKNSQYFDIEKLSKYLEKRTFEYLS